MYNFFFLFWRSEMSITWQLATILEKRPKGNSFGPHGNFPYDHSLVLEVFAAKT